MEKIISNIQHCGLPTENIEKTVSFYSNLGFRVAYQTLLEGKQKVSFLKCGSIVLEVYEEDKIAKTSGAWDHISLDVTNIEEAYQAIQKKKIPVIEKGIQFLPFWEAGVRFFTIQGPNGEKIEFSQML